MAKNISKMFCSIIPLNINIIEGIIDKAKDLISLDFFQKTIQNKRYKNTSVKFTII